MFFTKLPTEWMGSYSYTYGEGVLDQMPTINFELSMFRKLFGQIYGKIVEGEGGVPESAKIVGRISGRTVRFEKTYDHIWVMGEDYKVTSMKDSTVQAIQYNGELIDSGRAICGTWKSPEYYRPVNDEMCKFPKIGGTWEVVAKNRL